VVCFIMCVTVINGCAMNICAAVQKDHFLKKKKLHVVMQCVKERM